MPKYEPRTLRRIEFAEIEQDWTLAPPTRKSPAVGHTLAKDRIYIRVLNGTTKDPERYDYFWCDRDGTITSAPWGHAKRYKPGRIVDLDEAIRKHAGGAA